MATVRTSSSTIIIVLFFLIALLFLFSPAPAPEAKIYGTYVTINQYMGFIVNCDTSSYLEPAQHPNILLEKRSVRQSRPLYIILGHLFGNFLGIFTKPNTIEIYYWSFILINFLTIFLAIFLYCQILTYLGIDKMLIMIFSPYLICNDLIKAYLWSATPSLFGILTPIFSIYVGILVIKRSISLDRHLPFYSFLLGILPLLYGNFILLGIVVITAIYYDLSRCQKYTRSLFLLRSLIFTIFFTLPTIIWMTITTWISGKYFNVEVEIFREFIWISDSLGQDITELGRKFSENTLTYFSTFISLDVMCPILLSLMLLASFKAKSMPRREYQVSLLIFSFIAFCFFFFWLLGYYASRLTFTMVPPLILLIVISVNKALKDLRCPFTRVSIVAMIIVNLGWCCYHVTSYGPFS